MEELRCKTTNPWTKITKKYTVQAARSKIRHPPIWEHFSEVKAFAILHHNGEERVNEMPSTCTKESAMDVAYQTKTNCDETAFRQDFANRSLDEHVEHYSVQFRPENALKHAENIGST